MTKNLTLEDAKELTRGTLLHWGSCQVTYGITGHAQPRLRTEVWRVNGVPQIWKRSRRIRIPIKHGLYRSSAVEEWNYSEFHRETDCEAIRDIAEWWRNRKEERDRITSSL